MKEGAIYNSRNFNVLYNNIILGQDPQSTTVEISMFYITISLSKTEKDLQQ